MREEYQRPLDLHTDDLVVSMLLQVADDRTFWYMRAHHIAVDGYAAPDHPPDDRRAVQRGAQRRAPLEEKPFATLAEVVADDEKYQARHAPSHRRCALGVAGRRHAGTVDAVATRCDRARRTR